MTYLKNLTSDLLGLHGVRKRLLQAYSRLVNDCPPYLRDIRNKIHDFAWMDDTFEAKVLHWTYDCSLSFKEITANTGHIPMTRSSNSSGASMDNFTTPSGHRNDSFLMTYPLQS